MYQYSNGNTSVSILDDGTKIREWEGDAKPHHPESIDVKITNYCDLGCQFCHESSTVEGKHGDLSLLIDKLRGLPPGIELAIGGGNPLSHPHLIRCLRDLRSHGWIPNLTINQGHLKTYYDEIETIINDGLVGGIGISLTSNNWKWVDKIMRLDSHVVFHVIMGIHPPQIIEELVKKWGEKTKILILGYKQWGFGKEYFSSEVKTGILHWNWWLPRYMKMCTLSFDNLAIEQLDLKRLFTDEEWSEFYMGDDGTFTMYVDTVKGEWAPTSRSPQKDRKSWEISLSDYWKELQSGLVN